MKNYFIDVRTPLDPLFYYKESEVLFNEYKDKLDVDDFKTVLETTHFFDFIDIDKGELIGFIYFYQLDDKLFITACANRGHHHLNLACLKHALTFYNCDIYAEKVQKTAIYCILKCGFKKIKDGLYIYKRSENE